MMRWKYGSRFAQLALLPLADNAVGYPCDTYLCGTQRVSEHASRRGDRMAGHIDVRVKVSAPLEVMWEVANEIETPGTATGPADRHAQNHEIVQWNPELNRITYRINPGPDPANRTWAYQAERIVNAADKTAYARRWGNENFLYSYAFWQYTGTGAESELRCVADFEMIPGSPMDDGQMEAFMSRGTLAAMEKTARAAEAEAARRAGASRPGPEE